MNWQTIVGWATVAACSLTAGFWAFWGANEAFHEGWYSPHLTGRLMGLVPYLAPMAIFIVLATIGIRWPWAGAVLFILAAVLIAILTVLDRATIGRGILLGLTAWPVLLGIGFLVGRPEPKGAAYVLAICLPLAILVAFGIEPVIRVSTRFDDGDRGTRVVVGNGVTLLWAPAGPGWSRRGGVSWNEAIDRASRLSEDGRTLEDHAVDIWRLPTRDEVVRSLTRGGRNAGGTWDPALRRAKYRSKPDKEAPLWDPYSPLIYLWTRDQAGKNRAWIVVYGGGVFQKAKSLSSGSVGFRAVRDAAGEAGQ